jgi:hypothetical protein
MTTTPLQSNFDDFQVQVGKWVEKKNEEEVRSKSLTVFTGLVRVSTVVGKGKTKRLHVKKNQTFFFSNS